MITTAWQGDPNLHNPAFIHGYESLLCFCLAGTIVACWLAWRNN